MQQMQMLKYGDWIWKILKKVAICCIEKLLESERLLVIRQSLIVVIFYIANYDHTY